MQPEAFFSGIKRELDGAQRDRYSKVARLFTEVAPRLASAKRLDRELDQHLARRFNVFEYLRADELGLSHMIADLLDPSASHGQGSFFLREFLRLLPPSRSLTALAMLDHSQVSVTLEHLIPKQRRIDIVVDISGSENQSRWALAFENKPYADDQDNQVRDYLRHLHRQYGHNFLLIYLSPRGEGPSEWSIPSRDLQKCWQDNFAILPYAPRAPNDESDEFQAYRLRSSLGGWLQSCRNNCEVERLRWFLGDAIQFCRKTFGDHTMTSKHESKTIRDFLFAHPEHFETALAVHDSWTAIRDEICKKFLERLAERIESDERLQTFADDLQVGWKYEGRPRNSNRLWLYRNKWREYEGGDNTTDQRTAICLQSDGYGPNNWCVGVRSPLYKQEMTEEDKRRRQAIEDELAQKLDPSRASGAWPNWAYLDATARNWDSLVPDLHREAEQRGEITCYIVDKIVKVADAAIPVINKWDGVVEPEERVETSPSD